MLHNPVVDQITNHRSIRKFKDQTLTAEQLQTLYAAASQTSTSMFMQQFSILHVTDEKLREGVRNISGQPYIGGKVRKAGVARDFIHGVAFVLAHEVGIFNFFANYVLPRPDVIEDDKGQSRQVLKQGVEDECGLPPLRRLFTTPEPVNGRILSLSTKKEVS